MSTPLTSGVSRTGEWAGEISSPDEAADPRRQQPEPTRLPTVVFTEPLPGPEPRLPEPVQVGEAGAIPDSSLEYELEYYDEEPIRRRPKLVPVVVAFVVAAAVACLFAAGERPLRRPRPMPSAGGR